MDTFVLAALIALWLLTLIPAVILPFLPLNPEATPSRAPHPAGPLSFLPPTSPTDTHGGQAIA